ESGTYGHHSIDVFGRVVAQIEAAVIARLGEYGVRVVRLPENKPVNFAVAQRGDHLGTARPEADELDLRKIGAAELRRCAKQDVGIAVGRHADALAFQILPGVRRHAGSQRQALRAGKHAGDDLVILETQLLHQPDVDVAHDGNVDLIGGQCELEI